MPSDHHESHVLMIFNHLTSYVEDVLKSYILNEILLVAISILRSSLFIWFHREDFTFSRSILREWNSILNYRKWIFTNIKNHFCLYEIEYYIGENQFYNDETQIYSIQMKLTKLKIIFIVLNFNFIHMQMNFTLLV